MRSAQAECQRLNRELNEEMPVNVNGLVDAKKVCLSGGAAVDYRGLNLFLGSRR